jgi:putative transposase
VLPAIPVSSLLRRGRATDFLVVKTVRFRLLFVFVGLAHQRRHAIHFNVIAHPTAAWMARQVAEAFPWDSAPRYLLHDRDCIYGRHSVSALRKWASAKC